MSDLEEFKSQYGQDWKNAIESPMFRALYCLLEIRNNNRILEVTNERSERNSREILSFVQGYATCLNDLVTIPEQEEFTFPVEEEERYISPEEEAQHLAVIEKFTKKKK